MNEVQTLFIYMTVEYRYWNLWIIWC